MMVDDCNNCQDTTLEIMNSDIDKARVLLKIK